MSRPVWNLLVLRSPLAPRILLASLALIAAAGCGSGDEDAAVEVSDRWLAQMDAGDYEACWEQGATVFRRNLSAEEFAQSIREAREPLGKLVSRKLRTAQAARTLPNSPRGRYVVVQYDAVFENQQATVETVTAQLEDGEWRILGYRSR